MATVTEIKKQVLELATELGFDGDDVVTGDKRRKASWEDALVKLQELARDCALVEADGLVTDEYGEDEDEAVVEQQPTSYTLEVGGTSYEIELLEWVGDGGKKGWSARCSDGCHETSVYETAYEASEAMEEHLLVHSSCYQQELEDDEWLMSWGLPKLPTIDDARDDAREPSSCDVMLGWMYANCPLPELAVAEVARERGTSELLGLPQLMPPTAAVTIVAEPTKDSCNLRDVVVATKVTPPSTTAALPILCLALVVWLVVELLTCAVRVVAKVALVVQHLCHERRLSEGRIAVVGSGCRSSVGAIA